MMTKGERIKELREKAGMTQEELAKRLHTTKQTIHKYEKNIVTNIPSDRIKELAKILDSTPDYILGWKRATKEEIKESDANIDITDRLLKDEDFRIVVEMLNKLEGQQLLKAQTLLKLSFEQTFDEMEK